LTSLACNFPNLCCMFTRRGHSASGNTTSGKHGGVLGDSQ